MASIAEWIEKIKTAIYGEEVRGAIWQSLDAMNTQVDAINVDSAQIEQNKQDIATNTAAITALNSSAYMLKGGVAIPTNADLNTETYCVYGTYYVSSSTIAVSLANCPVRTVFRMIVAAMTSGENQNYHYVKRTIISGTKESDYNKYTQICQKEGPGTSWVFGSWKLEPTRAEVDALNSRLPHLNYINASSFEEATSLQTDTYLNIIDVLGTVDSPNSSYNRWFGFQYLNGTKKYGFQIAFSFGISALYMRRRNNSDTWAEWTAIQ